MVQMYQIFVCKSTRLFEFIKKFFQGEVLFHITVIHNKQIINKSHICHL